jgi:uncharacterized protein (TIGR01777 family)
MTTEEPKCVLVTGTTGLVGKRLVPRLAERFDQVRSVSRSRNGATQRPDAKQTRFAWNGIDPGSEAVAGARAVVHLAGEPIFAGLLTKARRARIRSSRVDSTRAIVRRFGELEPAVRPECLVCASAVGYYGDRGDAWLTEDSPSGTGFLADVCREWEAAASEAEALGVRVVRLRIGVVLAAEGGALSMMRGPFSLGLGGRLGDGQQFFPWIQIEDLVEIILWTLDHPVTGAINAVAPETVRNAEFTRALAAALARPAILPVPAFALRLALGELADELLGSRRIRPARLQAEAYPFRHPDLEGALTASL